MTLSKLPPVQELHTSSDDVQLEVLDALFEPSPAIHETLLPIIKTGAYTSWPHLIDSCHIQLRSLVSSGSSSSIDPSLLSVLGSHPRLGEKKIESQHSVAEQANLQKNSTTAQEEQLAQLNRQYEDTFPGLRFVVFVNGRGRPEIMDVMRARIAREDYSKEVDEALQVSHLDLIV